MNDHDLLNKTFVLEIISCFGIIIILYLLVHNYNNSKFKPIELSINLDKNKLTDSITINKISRSTPTTTSDYLNYYNNSSNVNEPKQLNDNKEYILDSLQTGRVHSPSGKLPGSKITNTINF